MAGIPKKNRATCYGTLSLPTKLNVFALCIQISVLSCTIFTPFQVNIDEIEILKVAESFTGFFGQESVGIISDKAWLLEEIIPFILIGSAIMAVSLLSLTNFRGTINFSGINLFGSNYYCCTHAGTFIQGANNKNNIFIICTLYLAFYTMIWNMVKEEHTVHTEINTQPSSSH